MIRLTSRKNGYVMFQNSGVADFFALFLVGFTRVFVEATEEICEIYRNLDAYFKEERHATFACDDGRVYPKGAPEGRTFFYCKGMYVLTTNDASLYDLDLYRLPINDRKASGS